MDLDRLRVTAGEFTFELDPGADMVETVGHDVEMSAGAGEPAAGGVLVLPLNQAPNAHASGLRRYEVVADGWRFEVTVESAARALLRERAQTGGGGARSSGTERVRAQIPGRIASVYVSEGDEIEAGSRLLSLEAMKMENEVRAPRAGRIGRVAVAAGQRVELGDELVVIE